MEAFCAAQGTGDRWPAACRACAERLDPLPPGASLGFVYVNGPLAASLDQIAARLRELTGVCDWVGAGGAGVCASGQEHFEQGGDRGAGRGGAERGFRLFDLQRDCRRRSAPPWPTAPGQRRRSGAVGLGVVHGAASQPDMVGAIADLSEAPMRSWSAAWRRRPPPDRRPADRRRPVGRAAGRRRAGDHRAVPGLHADRPGARGNGLPGPVDQVPRPTSGARRAQGGHRRGPRARPPADRGLRPGRDPARGSDRADYLVRNLLGLEERAAWSRSARSCAAATR